MFQLKRNTPKDKCVCGFFKKRRWVWGRGGLKNKAPLRSLLSDNKKKSKTG